MVILRKIFIQEFLVTLRMKVETKLSKKESNRSSFFMEHILLSPDRKAEAGDSGQVRCPQRVTAGSVLSCHSQIAVRLYCRALQRLLHTPWDCVECWC